jgi:hypothetical protein
MLDTVPNVLLRLGAIAIIGWYFSRVIYQIGTRYYRGRDLKRGQA